jgi:TorA maturation chaperone TorD
VRRRASILARARARTYSLLALAFALPRRSTVGMWSSARGRAGVALACRRLRVPGWRHAVAAVAREAEVLCREGPPSLQRLRAEYCRLFYGPAPLPSPPYASVYSDGGVVMGPETFAIANLCAHGGYRLPATGEPPDHIRFLLRCMAVLCQREARWLEHGSPALRRTLGLEQALLNRHLRPWVPEFARRIQVHAAEPLYVAVARLVTLWLAADAAYVESSLGAFRRGPVRVIAGRP